MQKQLLWLHAFFIFVLEIWNIFLCFRLYFRAAFILNNGKDIQRIQDHDDDEYFPML